MQVYTVITYISFSFAFQGPTRSTNSTYWCLICRENGCLEIYSLPEFKLVFSSNNFENAPKVLNDCGDNQENSWQVRIIFL